MALTKVSRGLLSTSIVDNGNATAITIDSSENVGIGTSSPTTSLDLASTNFGLPPTSGTTPNAFMRVGYTDRTWTGSEMFFGIVNAHPDYAGFVQMKMPTDYSTNRAFSINPQGGNVGIGTSSPNGNGILTLNTPADNSAQIVFAENDTAKWLIGHRHDGDYFRFYDLANSAERMRIDASGSVGIGVSSPSTRLEVGGGGGTEAIKVSAGAGWADLRLHSNATNGGSIYFNDGADAGQLFYYHVDDSMRFHTATAERMRIGSSGQVKIANGGSLNFDTTSSGNFDIAYKASDNTFNIINNSSSAAMGFHTSSTERMRIDSSGNLLVGTTDADSGSGNGVKIIPANGGTNKPRVAISTAGYAGEVALSLYSTAVSAWRFYVQANGTISAVNTTITSLSDERVKENIRDLDDGLSKVMQLQPRKFDWKEGKGKDISDDRGFIAQEFEQVFPDMISEWKDEAPEGEEAYKAINANLIPTLVKAIQEQQTLIESLTARIAALEE
jgi:hypothetical protein